MAKEKFEKLVKIMDELREKCPWDKKQTLQTLISLSVEELYELADGVYKNDWNVIKEELGDLLLHLLFYAKIASENKAFDIGDVIEHITAKMIFRHPHIYGEVQVENEEDVKRNWEKLKLKEGKKSVLEGVPDGLPALIKAVRIQEKAKQAGFEWTNIQDVWQKVEEEVTELQEAVVQQHLSHIEEEFGDVLFALINYARFLNIDAETALAKTNQKFITRFQSMERQAKEQQQDFIQLTLEEKESLWQNAKKEM